MPMSPRSPRHVALLFSAAVALAARANPQQEVAPAPPATPAPAASAATEPHFIALRWPRDKDTPVAVVGSRTLTLGDLVAHLDSRHHPGFTKALETTPTVEAMLRSDLIAPWVRHFADLEALRQTYGDELADTAKLDAAHSEALKGAFQIYLDSYVKRLANEGRPTELSQRRVNLLLADFQLRSGLATELQGTLDLLEPGDYTRGQLHQFFNDNIRAFGGQVAIAHILVQHRDGGTGILLREQGIARANERLAQIKGQLRPDGSNFEEIARLHSEDTRTANDGGRLGNVHRYDDRLPATLCRKAWALRDGEISLEPVETPYGFHLVKRIEFQQQILVLFNDDAIPSIRIVMRRGLQEERLMKAREKTGLRLLL